MQGCYCSLLPSVHSVNDINVMVNTILNKPNKPRMFDWCLRRPNLSNWLRVAVKDCNNVRYLAKQLHSAMLFFPQNLLLIMFLETCE